MGRYHQPAAASSSCGSGHLLIDSSCLRVCMACQKALQYQVIRCHCIEAGDEVEVDFDSGVITNKTKGTTFKGQPFPEFMQKLIASGGLVNYINEK